MARKKVSRNNEFHGVRVQEFQRELAALQEPAPSSRQSASLSYFVPTLVELCAGVIASNFASIVDADKLQDEHPELCERVIELLPTDIPLTVSVPRVRNDSYWRRCCEARWSFGQLSERTRGKVSSPDRGGWKRFYLEKLLSDFLLGLRSPKITNEESYQLDRLCLVCRDFVYDVDLPCQFTRFSMYDRLLSKMPHVERLRLTYGASNTGTDFHWGMIGFEESDALEFRFTLAKYTPLRELRLPNNRLNSSLLKGIISSLVQNTTMRVLDFSSNRIDDDGAQQLALLLWRPEFPLEELYLHDNQIRGDGAVALGEALSMNRTLRVLSVRLNRIPDEPGGTALIAGLTAHPSLEVLDVSHNVLGPATAQSLAEVLPQQTSLLSLDVSGNTPIGAAGGGADLLKAVQGSRTLRLLDVRGCGLPEEEVAAMEAIVRSCVEAAKAPLVDAQEAEQRARILQQVENKLAKTLCI